jgi:hypothetical protein
MTLNKKVGGKKIHLIDIDSTMPNVALMKLAMYHRQRGDIVTFSKGVNAPICNEGSEPDKVYASIIFQWNRHVLDNFGWNYHGIELDIGGSGYDLKKKLPPEVEACAPDYSLYPENDSSIGYSSRGCIRRCGFCVVREKEGYYHRTDHPEKWFNPAYQKITFLDSNILCDPSWFMEITNWCLEKGLMIWFSQGLDIRLITPEIIERLFEFRTHHMITFAWDDIRDEAEIMEKLTLLKTVFNYSDCRAHVQFYVYVDNDSNEEYQSAVYRCRKLKSLGCNVFPMINEVYRSKRLSDIQRWAARKWTFWKCDIDRYNKPPVVETNFVTHDIDNWI